MDRLAGCLNVSRFLNDIALLLVICLDEGTSFCATMHNRVLSTEKEIF
jgi:hypothetical protein